MSAPYEVYFDFDNTITSFDVLDEIIKRFSIDDEWIQLEQDWAESKIGSKQCLEGQIAKVRAYPTQLSEYFRTIKIDPAFHEILSELSKSGIEPTIISDSFTPFIAEILTLNGIGPIRILANSIAFEGDRPIVQFPYFNSICSTAANCKTSHLLNRGRPAGTKKIYIGDGRSDICPAQFCEILFAKGTLYQHYAGRRSNLIYFETLSTVHAELKLLLI